MALQSVRVPVRGSRARGNTPARTLLAAAAIAGQAVLAVTSAQPAAAATVTRPDMQLKVPVKDISIGTNSSNGHRQLQFTHVTWDAGTGPFEIDPVYNSVTGTARFYQAIYNSPSAGVWKRDHRVPLAVTGTFDWPSDYRFPLTRFALTGVKADGSPGKVVARSPKKDYCITGDIKVGGVPDTPDQTFIPESNCTNPSAPLGWSVGWGDQYDQTDNGQPIDLTGIPDGTYDLRGIVDPEHVLTESNRSNDVVITKLSISGTGVSVLKQYRPVVRPPTVTLTSPASGATVTTAVTLRAKASAPAPARVSSVRFLLDGEPLGTPVKSSPYNFRWQVGGTPPGTHWLSARVIDSRGVLSTAPVVKVKVAAGAATVSVESLISRPGRSLPATVWLAPAAAPPPAVRIVNPSPGQTVSGTVPVAVVVSGGGPARWMRFFLDGHPLGPPMTALPYAIRWRTTAAANGGHTLSVKAGSASGQASTARMRVTVQNPAPAMTCFVMQAQRNAEGRGTVATKEFDAVSADETLLAFASSAGPGHGVRQAVTIAGGGLAWRLVARADRQQGDAEIWEAAVDKPLTGVRVTSTPTWPGYRQALTVIAMEGTDGTRAVAAKSGPGGRPAVTLTTRHDVSLVFAVGTASGSSRAGALPAGWVALHARFGDEPFWSQYTNVPVPEAGLTVTVGGPVAGSGRWNLAAVELAGDGS
jgi:hypothetical protein